ncbi:hypothetical protein ES705_41726 [subsurface metagenome]
MPVKELALRVTVPVLLCDIKSTSIVPPGTASIVCVRLLVPVRTNLAILGQPTNIVKVMSLL